MISSVSVVVVVMGSVYESISNKFGAVLPMVSVTLALTSFAQVIVPEFAVMVSVAHDRL
jgi:hypothetical protein